MLPVYFFTVLFFIVIGFFFAFLENNKISNITYKTNEAFFTSKNFNLICAIVAIILTILKIFVPVQSSGSTIYLVGDLIPVFMGLILTAIFSYRYFSSIGQNFSSIKKIIEVLNQHCVVVGYISIIVGVLHLLFAQIFLF